MCGCHQGGVPAIEALLRHGYHFQSFVCLSPEQAARYEVAGYFDYRPLAEEHGIPVYHPQSYSLDSGEDRSYFDRHRFSLLIQGGWQRLFPAGVLTMLSIGAVGLHGSADLYLKDAGGRR